VRTMCANVARNMLQTAALSSTIPRRSFVPRVIHILRRGHPSPWPSFAVAILRRGHPSPWPSFAVAILRRGRNTRFAGLTCLINRACVVFDEAVVLAGWDVSRVEGEGICDCERAGIASDDEIVEPAHEHKAEEPGRLLRVCRGRGFFEGDREGG